MPTIPDPTGRAYKALGSLAQGHLDTVIESIPTGPSSCYVQAIGQVGGNAAAAQLGGTGLQLGARDPGPAGNALTLALVGRAPDGAGVTVDASAAPAVVVSYESGVSTLGDVNAALSPLTNLIVARVFFGDGGAVLTAPGSDIAPVALAGGAFHWISAYHGDGGPYGISGNIDLYAFNYITGTTVAELEADLATGIDNLGTALGIRVKTPGTGSIAGAAAMSDWPAPNGGAGLIRLIATAQGVAGNLLSAALVGGAGAGEGVTLDASNAPAYVINYEPGVTTWIQMANAINALHTAFWVCNVPNDRDSLISEDLSPQTFSGGVDPGSLSSPADNFDPQPFDVPQIPAVGSDMTFLTSREGLHREVRINVLIDPMSSLVIPHGLGEKPTVVATATPSLVVVSEVGSATFKATNWSLKQEAVLFIASLSHVGNSAPNDYYNPIALIALEMARRNRILDGMGCAASATPCVQATGAVPAEVHLAQQHGHAIVFDRLGVVPDQELTPPPPPVLAVGERATLLVLARLSNSMASGEGPTMACLWGTPWTGELADTAKHLPDAASIAAAVAASTDCPDYLVESFATLHRSDDTTVALDIDNTPIPDHVPPMPTRVALTAGEPDGNTSILTGSVNDLFGYPIIGVRRVLVEAIGGTLTVTADTVALTGNGTGAVLLSTVADASFSVALVRTGDGPAIVKATSPTGIVTTLLVVPAVS